MFFSETFQETKRAYGRYRLDGAAVLVAGDGKEETSILKDLSCRGAGVVTSHPLKLNDQLSIIINASSLFNQPVTRQARVAWCQHIASNLWQAGLDFGEANKVFFTPTPVL